MRGFARAERCRVDGGRRRRGRAEQQLGGSEAGWERPAVSGSGKALRLNVRNEDRADCMAFLAAAVPSTTIVLYSTKGDVEGGQHELGFMLS